MLGAAIWWSGRWECIIWINCQFADGMCSRKHLVWWMKTCQALYLNCLCMEENHKGGGSDPHLEEWGIPEVMGKILNLAKEICSRDANTLSMHPALCHSVTSGAAELKVFHPVGGLLPSQSPNRSEQRVGPLTSRIGFEQQGISNERIRFFRLGNGLHLKPIAQVAAEQLVGDVGERGDRDAHNKKGDGGTPQHRHVRLCVCTQRVCGGGSGGGRCLPCRPATHLLSLLTLLHCPVT